MEQELNSHLVSLSCVISHEKAANGLTFMHFLIYPNLTSVVVDALFYLHTFAFSPSSIYANFSQLN